MKTTLIKVIAAIGCTATALGLSLNGPSGTVEGAKDAKPVTGSSQVMVISNPENPDDYGIGTYRVEGILAKNTKVKILLDNKVVKDLTTNSEDGQYDLDVKVEEAGKHELLLAYKDSKGKDTFRKLEFSASKMRIRSSDPVEPDDTNEDVPVDDSTTSNPLKHDDDPVKDDETETVDPKSLLPDDDSSNSSDPNSSENRKASGVNDGKLKKPVPAKPKPSVAKPKPAPGRTLPTKGLFVLSSHTNYNVVPNGIINIGGKGNPGDKIMLLVDNKPSMKGTIKPNGRWSFPVKISNPGFRKITAQDLRSREAKTIKLKIK